MSGKAHPPSVGPPPSPRARNSAAPSTTVRRNPKSASSGPPGTAVRVTSVQDPRAGHPAKVAPAAPLEKASQKETQKLRFRPASSTLKKPRLRSSRAIMGIRPVLIWGPAVALAGLGCVLYLWLAHWSPRAQAATPPGEVATPVRRTPENFSAAQVPEVPGMESKVQVVEAQKKPRRPRLSPAVFGGKIVKRYQHDPAAFTQGLVYAGKDAGGNDILYESTGLYGQSTVRRVVLQTGKVLKSQKNGAQEFGEGIAMVDGGARLAQVTWQTRTVNLFGVPGLKKLGQAQHGMTDGWGLTESEDGNLYGSDGTAFLYKLSSKDFSVLSKVEVKDGDKPIVYLNELERVNSLVWANVWQTPCIARVDPRTGKVVSWLVLDNLVSEVRSSGLAVDVLNGIAWDGAGKRLFVTGKQWPTLYEIQLLESKPQNPARFLRGVRSKCWPQGGA